MINLSYKDELGKLINCRVANWEAVYAVAEMLVKAPIDLEYIDYIDGDKVGTFNLNNFERC